MSQSPPENGTGETPDIPDYRWQQVDCSRCERVYKCTPWDDFYDPAEYLGWPKGGVCYDCLIELGQQYHKKHTYQPAPWDVKGGLS